MDFHRAVSIVMKPSGNQTGKYSAGVRALARVCYQTCDARKRRICRDMVRASRARTIQHVAKAGGVCERDL